jgi:hypothetical protein
MKVIDEIENRLNNNESGGTKFCPLIRNYCNANCEWAVDYEQDDGCPVSCAVIVLLKKLQYVGKDVRFAADNSGLILEHFKDKEG